MSELHYVLRQVRAEKHKGRKCLKNVLVAVLCVLDIVIALYTLFAPDNCR